VTITPERLAELRKQIGDNIGPYRFFVPTNVDEFRDLLDAADNLAALLAAAEVLSDCFDEAQRIYDDKNNGDWVEPLLANTERTKAAWSTLRAAIRRAKGEQP